MFEPAAILSRAVEGFRDLPGGLLTWSLVLVFFAVVLAVLGIAGATRPATARRRLEGGGAPPETAAPPGLRLAGPGLSRRLVPRAEAPWALTWAVALPLVFGLVLLAGGWALPGSWGLYFGAALAVLGGLAPGRWRAWRTHRRRDALRRGFPDALDMTVVCVEAGLGLDAALNRVALEIAPVHPGLAVELTRIGRELRAGRERGAVLRGFARRAGLPEVASFATLLIQSEALGTGVARSLRVQAEEMRATRMLLAEERAHTLPVKLAVPLVFCVLPAMIAVVLLPGAIAIVRDILPNLGG